MDGLSPSLSLKRPGEHSPPFHSDFRIVWYPTYSGQASRLRRVASGSSLRLERFGRDNRLLSERNCRIEPDLSPD